MGFMALAKMGAGAAWGAGKFLLGGGVTRQAAIGAGFGAISGAMEETYNTNTRIENILKGAAGGALTFGATAAAFKYGPRAIKAGVGGIVRSNRAAGQRYAASEYKKLVGAGNFNRRMKRPELRADYEKRFSRFRHTPIARNAMRDIGRMGRGAMVVGQFASRHPYMTGAGILGAGAIAGGIYAGNQMAIQESPTFSGAQMNADYNQQEIAAQNIMGGVAPMGMVGPATSMMGPMHRAMQQSTQGLVQGLHRGRH